MQRIFGVDHRAVMVDINNSFWDKEDNGGLKGDEIYNVVHPRIGVSKWNKEDYEGYRERVRKNLAEKDKFAPCKKQPMLLTTKSRRRIRGVRGGEEWIMCTADAET